MHTDQAIEIFLSGVLGVPSMENRSERWLVDGLTILHDDDIWNLNRRITDEVVVRSHSPAAVLSTVASGHVAPKHLITLIDRPTSDHAAYLAAGYHQTAAESLMVRPLTNLPPLDSRYVVERATTLAQLAWLNQHDPAGKAWITPTRLHEPRFRHTFITLDQRPVVRARVCRVDEAHSYVSNVYTAEAYRRRGLAQAVMAHILHDGVAHGEHWSVLVSSAAGLPLYQSLGYQHCASLVVFEPNP